MRAAMLLLCLTLAGCITTADDPAHPTDGSKPAATPAQPAAPNATPATPPRRAPAQALRGSSAPPATAPEPEPQTDPVLAIRQTCWSQVDRNKTLRTLEARADWVDKCIADKSKALAGP